MVKRIKKAGVKNLGLDAEYSYAIDNTKERYYKYIYQIFKYYEKIINEQGFYLNTWLPYIHKIQTWAIENHDKLQNETSDKIVTIDISKQNKSEIEKILSEIIETNSIWNKPAIQIISDKDVTENKSFENILHLCYTNGFKTIVNTNAKLLSTNITEALKYCDIELNANSNGKYSKVYHNISPEKVKLI